MASLLRTGSKGTEVTRVQHILNKIKIAKTPLELDGDFGPKTLDAVKAFQLSEGIAADGIVGPETEKRMVRRYRGVQPGKRNGAPPASKDYASFGVVEAATQIALSQLQVREVPLGRSPQRFLLVYVVCLLVLRSSVG
jgi:peptidoglycan hydrolase-like protein with peptidoglycan-binding domain